MQIYTIMVTEKLEQNPVTGLPYYGSTRVPGFFTEKQAAIDAVRGNLLDINEHCYNYACIEECLEGVYCPGDLVGWFEFDHTVGRYFEIETPSFEKKVTARSIG